MSIVKLYIFAIAIGAQIFSLLPAAYAATVSLNPILDGFARRISTNGHQIGSAAGENITVRRFSFGGGIIDLRGILVFDLSSIADGSTINSVSLDITLLGSVGSESSSGTTLGTAITAYADDNMIDGDDFIPFGLFRSTQFSGSMPGGVGSVAGDVRSFAFRSPASIENILVSNILGLQIRSARARFSFASLEKTDL